MLGSVRRNDKPWMPRKSGKSSQNEISIECYLRVTYKLSSCKAFNLRELTKSEKSKLDPEHGDVRKVLPFIFILPEPLHFLAWSLFIINVCGINK